MRKIQPDQSGFSAVETVLVLVILVIIGFVGWYVVHTKHNTDKDLGIRGSSTQAGSNTAGQKTATGTDNQSLQSDLGGIDSANNQTTKDLNSSNNGLSDSSTFTSVPQ